MTILVNKAHLPKLIHMGMYPTLGSLQEVLDLCESKLPITSKNAMTSLLMTYHNTLLSVANKE